MPRQSRQSSGTGIYHVMMRGINHQNIFEDQKDYYQFLSTLDAMSQSYEKDGLVNEPLSDDICCLDIEDVSKGRPSDDQVMMLIKEKTGAPNSSAFQQLPDEVKRSVLIELKSRKASLRQLARLTGIGIGVIYRM